MPVCATCGTDRAQLEYSKAQLGKKAARRCKGCVAGSGSSGVEEGLFDVKCTVSHHGLIYTTSAPLAKDLGIGGRWERGNTAAVGDGGDVIKIAECTANGRACVALEMDSDGRVVLIERKGIKRTELSSKKAVLGAAQALLDGNKLTATNKFAKVALGRETQGKLDDTLLGADTQGKLDAAEPLYREALRARRETLGATHPDTLTSMSNLASLLKAQGKLDEAEPLYREVLRVQGGTLGEMSNDPDMLASMSNLASLLEDQGKLAEAEPLYREMLRVERQTLGDQHKDTLCSLHNLAVLLYAQDKHGEAELLCREALQLRRETLGEMHLETLDSMCNLTSLLEDQGKLDEAEPLYQNMLRVRRQTLGDQHEDTLANMYSLAAVLVQLDRVAEAVPLFEGELRGSLSCGDRDGAEDTAAILMVLLDEHGPAEMAASVAALCAENGIPLPPAATLTADGTEISCSYGFGPSSALEYSGDLIAADVAAGDFGAVHRKLALVQRGDPDADGYVPVGERVRLLSEAGAVAVVLANPGENQGVAGEGSIAVVCVNASDAARLASAAVVELVVVMRLGDTAEQQGAHVARMLADSTGLDLATATELLAAAGGDVEKIITMLEAEDSDSD